MKRLTTFFTGGAAVLALAALAAGCGSSSEASASGTSRNSSGGYAYGPSSSGGASNAGGATIAVAESSFGRILVDGQGRTVYLFENDTGTVSMCYGACASIWPPVTTSDAPNAGNGVDASKLGTTKRADGTMQVTYNSHPLYRYGGDSQPGQTNGEGVNSFGAEWYAVSPAGQAVEKGAS